MTITKDMPLRLEWLDPADLAENPSNWRTHPEAQRQGLEAVIGEVGWAGALLYNETTSRLIDGHARKKLPPESTVGGLVPVLVGQWTEEEERTILATLDPLAAMADSDREALDTLLDQVEASNETAAQLLAQVKAMDWQQETVPITSLRPHPRNYRNHPEDQINHLIQSVLDHGVYRKVLVARDNTILAGHGLCLALERLGHTHVTVARFDLDPHSPRALKILTGDNEAEHLAEVDDRARTELLKEVLDSGEGLLGTGFDEQMLAALAMVTRPREELADFDAAAEWVGMPEYEEGERTLKLTVSFRSVEDRAVFCEVLGLELADRTKTTWWPPREKEDLSSLRFE